MSIPSMSSAKFRYANVRGSTQALVEKGRRDGLCELCLDILLFQVDGKRLPTNSKNRSRMLRTRYASSTSNSRLISQTHFLASKKIFPNNLGIIGMILSSHKKT